MSLSKLVPTMGLIAAVASPAFAFDLASAADGKLHVSGYVDTTFEYTAFEKNAPRHGDFDNQALWDARLRQGIPYGLSISGSSVSLVGQASLTPTINATAYLANFGLVSMSSDPTWSYFGGSGTTTGGSAYLTSIALAGLTLSPSVGFTQYFYDLQGKKQDIKDFKTTAELGVDWNIGEKVKAKIEVELSNANAVSVEQALISWDCHDMINLTAGKMNTWNGLEATDPTGLNRINTSIVYGLQGQGVLDGIVGTATLVNDEQHMFSIGLGIVDSIYGDPLGVKDGNDLAAALLLRYERKDGSFKAGLNVNYDHNATVKTDAANQIFDYVNLYPAFGLNIAGGYTTQQLLFLYDGGYRDSVLGINFNAVADFDGKDNGFEFGLDAYYTDYELAEAMGIMAYANYKLDKELTAFPMAFTLMGAYHVPNTEDAKVRMVPTIAGGTITGMTNYLQQNGEDAEEIEIALAYLTQPTNDPNFSMNFEIRYIIRDDVKLADEYTDLKIKGRSEVGFFVELLAVIP